MEVSSLSPSDLSMAALNFQDRRYFSPLFLAAGFAFPSYSLSESHGLLDWRFNLLCCCFPLHFFNILATASFLTRADNFSEVFSTLDDSAFFSTGGRCRNCYRSPGSCGVEPGPWGWCQKSSSRQPQHYVRRSPRWRRSPRVLGHSCGRRARGWTGTGLDYAALSSSWGLTWWFPRYLWSLITSLLPLNGCAALLSLGRPESRF